MSTKALQEHKKVAEVTLNEQGKAKTITLKAPWLFEGSRGPFDLKSVEHGHKITKAAYHEDKGPPAKIVKAQEPMAPVNSGIGPPFLRAAAPPAPVGPSYVREAPEPLEMPDAAFLVWNGLAVNDDRDIVFWFYTLRRQPISDIQKAARRALTRLLVGRDWGAAGEYLTFIREHTEADEVKRPSPFNHLSATLGRVT